MESDRNPFGIDAECLRDSDYFGTGPRASELLMIEWCRRMGITRRWVLQPEQLAPGGVCEATRAEIVADVQAARWPEPGTEFAAEWQAAVEADRPDGPWEHTIGPE